MVKNSLPLKDLLKKKTAGENMNIIRFNWLLARYKYDREAVTELYEFYYPVIVRYINRQFRGAVDGQDVAQQFFLKLFTCKSNPIRAPNAWVRTVAKNIALDVLRKTGRQREAESFAAMPEEVFLPENLSDELKCLNETEKKIVYLRYWERYKLKEISDLLKIKYGCAKSIHAAAKMKIRKEFTKEKYNEEFT